MLSESDIPWTPTSEPLSLRSETDIEAAYVNLSEAERIAWLVGLVQDTESLRLTVHACMDACQRYTHHHAKLEDAYHRLLAEYRRYRGIATDLGQDALKNQTYAE